jgi:Leucine-rich repeat (LRR) protein
LGNLKKLNLLNLSYNDLSGEIPEELGNIPRLNYLFLFDNNLTGSIPSTFTGDNQLLVIGAADNELSGEIPAFLGELPLLSRLELQNNQFIGCFPEELRLICDEDVNFSGNIALPWQGDFSQFCNESTQLGAPCEDGLANTINYIDANCDCIAILTSLSEYRDFTFNIFPNPVQDELFITHEINGDSFICTILSVDGQIIDMIEGRRYDSSGLPPGLYLLALQDVTNWSKKSNKNDQTIIDLRGNIFSEIINRKS